MSVHPLKRCVPVAGEAGIKRLLERQETCGSSFETFPRRRRPHLEGWEHANRRWLCPALLVPDCADLRREVRMRIRVRIRVRIREQSHTAEQADKVGTTATRWKKCVRKRNLVPVKRCMHVGWMQLHQRLGLTGHSDAQLAQSVARKSNAGH